MGFDQKGSLMFRVARGTTGQWVVTEDGFEKPLASFDAQIDALEYAEDIAKTRRGSKTGHELPGHSKAGRSH